MFTSLGSTKAFTCLRAYVHVLWEERVMKIVTLLSQAKRGQMRVMVK